MFIVFEGIDKSGKSTQHSLLYHYLMSQKYNVIVCADPGSTPISQKIRNILLDKNSKITKEAEMLMYCAARTEMVQNIIKPALKQNKIVLCDRFYMSTLAYQGSGRNISSRFIQEITDMTIQGIEPDLIVYINIPMSIFVERKSDNDNRMDLQTLDFYKLVKLGYEYQVDSCLDDSLWFEVDGRLSIEEQHSLIKNEIKERMGL